MATDAPQPSIPDKIRRDCIVPEEQIIFASADAVLWTASQHQPIQAQLNQPFLRGSLGGGMHGGGAVLETIARTPRPREWKADKIDWIILTDQRLLFVTKGVPGRIFDLDPAKIKEWLAAERDAYAMASEAAKEAWSKKGVFAIFSHPKLGGEELANPPTLYTIRDAAAKWHLFRRNCIRLRVVVLAYGTPKFMRRMIGSALSGQDIQLRTAEDAERLVSLLGPRARIMSEAMAASPL
ncbi:MAG: hypothetical protein ACHQRJ_01830 [Alphaproteobacteria bacterium]